MKWISRDLLYQPTVRKHLGLVSGGFLLGILVYSFIRFSELQKPFEMLLCGGLGIAVAYSFNQSNTILNRLLPWRKQPGLRLLAGLLTQLALSNFLVLGALWGYHMLIDNLLLFKDDPEDISIKINILLFCVVLLFNIIYFAFYSYNSYAKGQVAELKLERKQTQLQLDALKSQLSPHFLFNSMNTLSSLFPKDVEKAETFIRALANSYQYTLDTYEAPLVSVAKELEFVNAYCFLMRTRFGDHLTLKVDIDPQDQQSKVPPMTLQMLVENAVKHNVMSAAQPLNIVIGVDGKQLYVNNNKTSKRPKMESLKIGLINIAMRYELLAQKPVEVLDKEDFTVRLPIVL